MNYDSDPSADPTNERELEEALRFDALDVASKITGDRDIEDEETMQLGMALYLANTQSKRELLESRHDTSYAMDPEKFKSIALNLGFEIVLQGHFRGDCCGRVTDEEWFIAWQPGILLWWETFGSEGNKSVNTAKMYYNWRFKRKNAEGEHNDAAFSCMSSGHCVPDGDDYYILVGDHDAREGLRFNLNKMRRNGEFVPNWIERPHLWLCEWGIKDPTALERCDWSVYDQARDAKIARLPQNVKDMLGPDKNN